MGASCRDRKGAPRKLLCTTEACLPGFGRWYESRGNTKGKEEDENAGDAMDNLRDAMDNLLTEHDLQFHSCVRRVMSGGTLPDR